MSDLIARLNALGFNVADTGEAFDKIKELQGQLIKDKPYLEVMEKNAKYIVELEVKLEKAEAKLKLQTHNVTKQEAIANEAIDKWSKVKAQLKVAEDALGKANALLKHLRCELALGFIAHKESLEDEKESIKMIDRCFKRFKQLREE